MKKFKLLLGSAGMFMLPMLVSAQDGLAKTGGGGGQFQTFIENLTVLINTVLIPFVLALAFLVFVWGMFQYFIAGAGNDESKEKGKSLMIWATVAFVFIIIFWGVVNFIVDTIGIDSTAPTAVEVAPITVPGGTT